MSNGQLSKRQPEPSAMIDGEAIGDAIRLSSGPVPISLILDLSGRWESPFEAVRAGPEG
jgi:hypothetical protein